MLEAGRRMRLARLFSLAALVLQEVKHALTLEGTRCGKGD
jgi:hypothetical protein